MFKPLVLKTSLIIFSLMFVCLSPLWAQGSVYVFPQVADGPTGNVFFYSNFLLNNVMSSDNTVTIQFFHSNGTPWVIDLRSNDRPEVTSHTSSATFVLHSAETANLYTGGVDPLTAGWAKVTSTLPLEVSEVFDVARAPLIVTSESGVLPGPLATQFSFEANVSSNEFGAPLSINTGFAIANPSAATATVTGTLLNRTGTQVSKTGNESVIAPKTITIPPNGQNVQFLSQLFNDFTFPPIFHGTVRFSSNVNVGIVALRDVNSGSGDIFSTIAVNPDSTLGYNIFYDQEPNNTFGTAQMITLPARVIGTMIQPDGSADVDFFAVNLQAGQTLSVFAVADILGSPLDDVIILFDPTHTQVAINDNFTIGLKDPFVSFTAPTTGTYFIEHGSTNGTSSRSSYYELLVRARF